MAGAGLYALIGFPLDDVWHRIFGQDVTLWGPTHLMLIGGAGFSLIGVLLLEFEGLRNRPSPERPETRRMWLLRACAFGGLLIGLSVFQVEYDFGVEQFRLVLQPMLIVTAATIALVAARLTLGAGSTLVVVGFAAAVRAVVAVLVGGPIIDAPRNVFPLYLGVAVVVELLALLPLVRRRILWGAICGLAAATIGLWLESLWIAVMFVDPWPSSMWPELLAMSIPTGIAGGVVGAMLAVVLRGEPLPRPAIRRTLVAVSVAVVAAATANGLMIDVPAGARAAVELRDAPEQGGRMVYADIRLTPADLVGTDPEWIQILAWQGGVGSEPGTGTRGRPTPARGRRALRLDETCSGARKLENSAADPGRADADRVTDFHGRRSRYRRRRGPRPRLVHPALRRRDHGAAAGAVLRSSGMVVRRSLAVRAGVQSRPDRRAVVGRRADQRSLPGRIPHRAGGTGARAMTDRYDGADLLADHSILLAVPAFLPAFLIAGVVVVIAVRDRKGGDEQDPPHDPDTGPDSASDKED